eukprot:m.244249 g.244249  ORF g.244249 m.244249 type:complete len:164 (-) comp30232_c0_seq1:35-526(-)
MLKFGQFSIARSEAFFFSPLSMALVNLKPLVPGHVLVCPQRVVPRFDGLTSEEVSDMWQTAQLVSNVLTKHLSATSLTFILQDGPEAGQTVEHVHVHVIPRHKGDFAQNDEIYRLLEAERVARSAADMAAEATLFSSLFAGLTLPSTDSTAAAAAPDASTTQH